MIAPTSARVSRRVGFATLLVAFAAAGGCGSTSPALSSTPYAGPPITIDRSGPTYLLRVESPSPGWVVRLDRVEPSLGQTTLTVTSRRPDPSYMYPQVIVTQDVLTTVDTRTPIDVYARVLEFAGTGKGVSYQFVGTSRAEEGAAPRP